jgi:hypothetical protein
VDNPEVHVADLMVVSPSNHDDKLDTATIRAEFHRSRKNGDLMGVMTRKSGESYIITSDRIAGQVSTKRAPDKRASGVYQVWTGNGWSATMNEAATFTGNDSADEYIRVNYARVMG